MFPVIDPSAKDWLQAVAWAATAIGVIVAFFKFRSEVQAAREQRERDLRWREAEAGKKLNDEMLHDPGAWAAMQMLDYSGRVFNLPSEAKQEITHQDLAAVLEPSASIKTEKDIYIRDCFDMLFYYMATLEHYISSPLIKAEDVAYPLDYYVPLLGAFKSQVDGYLSKYNLVRTRSFLSSHHGWK